MVWIFSSSLGYDSLPFSLVFCSIFVLIIVSPFLHIVVSIIFMISVVKRFFLHIFSLFRFFVSSLLWFWEYECSCDEWAYDRMRYLMTYKCKLVVFFGFCFGKNKNEWKNINNNNNKLLAKLQSICNSKKWRQHQF